MKKAVSLFMSAVIAATLLIWAPGAAVVVNAIDKTKLDILHGDMWSGSVKVDSRGSSISVSHTDGETTFSCQCDINEIDLSSYSELCMALSLRGSSEEYNVLVTVVGSSGENSTTKKVKCGITQRIYIPLDADVAATAERIEFSVPGEDIPVYAIISEIWVDNSYTYNTVESFDSEGITCPIGTASFNSSGITLTPDGSNAKIRIPFTSDTSKDNTYIVWIDISGSAMGNIEVNAKALSEEDSKITTSSRQILASGDHSYVFVVEGAFESISFDLDSIVFPGQNGFLRLSGAGVIDLGERGMESIGSISSCRYENGRVTLTGTIGDDAALDYVNSKLGLVVIPRGESENISLDDAECAVTSGFSTKFSLSVDMPAEQWRTSLYLPVIIDGEKTIQIAPPMSAQNSSQTANAVPTLLSAIEGAELCDTVESGVSAEIIDIYADKLMNSEDVYSATLFSYGGTVYYIDSDYFAEVQRRIDFDAAAGIRVYARVVSDSYTDIDFSAIDSESFQLLNALCSFIRNNLGKNISGYIMGRDLNSSVFSKSSSISGLSRIASLFAEGLRGNTSAEIYLPFSDSGEAHPIAAYAALRYSMAQHSAATVSLLYSLSTDNEIESSTASVARTVGVANSYGFPTDNGAVIWRPAENASEDSVAEAYASLCHSAQGLRFAAIDASGSRLSPSAYEKIKASVTSSRVFSANAELFFTNAENSSLGKYILQDHTSSYDTSGWIAGGAFTGVATELSALGNGRALRSYSRNAGSAGALAYRFDSPIDVSGADVLMSLGLVSESGGSAAVTVILNSSDSRYEFSANAEYNKIVTLKCDMKESSSPIESITVVVGSSECSVELYDLSLCSSLLSDDEMKSKFEGERSSSVDPMLYVVIVIVAAGTVAAFSAFLKKEDK